MSQNVNPPGNPVGIDVSKYQGNVNWTNVAAAGVSFAFARVSDGANSKDAFFAQNWAGMKNAGIIRGAYQFFRANQDPVAQANLMVAAVGQLGPGDLAPVIDIETGNGVNAGGIVAAVSKWQQVVESALGRQIIVYTARGFWQGNVGNSTQFADRPLWVANYTNAPAPSIPSAWSVWTFWQYTQNGTVNGINGQVDRNRFNGPLNRLRALAGYPPG
ncbi:MAG: GH25 family lysozyme [Pyrinomonadaceae bacterium]